MPGTLSHPVLLPNTEHRLTIFDFRFFKIKSEHRTQYDDPLNPEPHFPIMSLLIMKHLFLFGGGEAPNCSALYRILLSRINRENKILYIPVAD